MSVMHAPEKTNGRSAYAHYLKPYLADLLSAIQLDIEFERAEGDYLYYRDETGQEQPILDLLGGYGAALFGHNHPALVQKGMAVLTQQRPFVAQASIRSTAGLLAERLAEILWESTGEDYVVTLANTGTEAVEAALKHAALEKITAVQAIIEQQQRTFRAIRLAIRKNEIVLTDEWLAEAAELLNMPQLATLAELEYALTQLNEKVLTAAPKFLAVKGAFHGKTSGALMLTYNKEFRLPWQKLGLDGQFIPLNDVDALSTAVLDTATHYFALKREEKGLTLAKRPWTPIAGCLAEPIQGEGGIRELTTPFLQALRKVADTWHFPLIFDEIQSGIGRTGTFLAAQPSGVVADYYLFSKSLGGGLAKVSALLVKRDRYQDAFGMLHTSTFAEDDFSSAIALEALTLLTENDNALIKISGEKGDYFLAQLRSLQKQHPTIIKEVRGRGLMIGLELLPQIEQTISPLLRVLSEQNLLTYLLSGHLLHEANIRITPTLSAHNTIRIEPSVYIGYDEIDRFCGAFHEAALLLEAANLPRLLHFITGEYPTQDFLIDQPARPSATQRHPNEIVDRQVACLAHFMAPKDLRHWDPTLHSLSDKACQRLLAQTGDLLDPFIAAERVVVSPMGERIGLTIIGIPLTSAQIMHKMKQGKTKGILAQLKAGVELARQLGSSVVGFTGYTSIVSHNVTDIVADDMSLTSGNSLTAAAAIAAIQQTAVQMGIAPEEIHLGVVGAVGNIGRVMAEVAAGFAPRITLFGRDGAQKRLQRAAKGIQAQTAVQIATDLSELRHCNVIISATNAPQPIIRAEHIGDHPVLLCDVAVPADIDNALLAEKPNARLIKGGILSLPLGQDLAIGGMDVAPGQAYACVSESLLLGMAGIMSHFSYGILQSNRVKQALQLAETYEFTVVAQDESYVPVLARG